MKAWKYHEDRQRGSRDFPLEYHYIDAAHPRYDMPYHWHEEAELIYVRSGSLVLAADGEEYRLDAGNAAFLAPGRLHGGVPQDCVYECLVFDMRFLLKSSDHCRSFITDVISRRADVQLFLPGVQSAVQQAVLPLFEALRSRCTGFELITLGCLYRFIGEVYRCGLYELRDVQNEEPSSALKLKEIFELIESRLDHPPTLGELSAKVGMSPKYFCRFFRQATHRTPMDYIGFYRIEQACYEMAATEKNVTEVAMDLGYSDVNYFIRCFKKYKGVTPKQYLMRLRG